MQKQYITSFIHLSDVHLGKVSTISKKENRYEDFFHSFDSAIDYAIEKSVDFLLISGDLFDNKDPSPKTLSKCEEILSKLKYNNIEVFCVEGNHDRKKKNEKMSWIDYLQEKNLMIHLSVDFTNSNYPIIKNYDKESNSGTIYKHKSGINIIGFGWLGTYDIEKYIIELLNQLEGQNNIILLHAMLEKINTLDYGLIDKNIFKNYLNNILYVALGHGHTKKEYYNKIYNAGSLEYIRLKDFENPDRGYYYVSVYQDENKKLSIEAEHIKSKKRNFLNVKIDVSSIQTNEDLEIEIYKKISENWKNEYNSPIIKVDLTGISDFFSKHKLNLNNIEKKLSENYEFLTIIFNDNIDYFSEKMILRGGEDTNEITMEELGRKTIMTILAEEFSNDSLIDLYTAGKLTDIIWSSYKDIIEGLDEGKKESFIKSIYKSLWKESE